MRLHELREKGVHLKATEQPGIGLRVQRDGVGQWKGLQPGEKTEEPGWLLWQLAKGQ
jgi:hypothetical protein